MYTAGKHVLFLMKETQIWAREVPAPQGTGRRRVPLIFGWEWNEMEVDIYGVNKVLGLWIASCPWFSNTNYWKEFDFRCLLALESAEESPIMVVWQAAAC